MNFLEAMKTGRPFKRKGWNGYVTGVIQGTHVPFTAQGVSVYWKDNSKTGTRHHVCAEELLATDWEVEPKAILLTSEQIEAAISNVQNVDAPWDFLMSELLDELGFNRCN